MEMGRFEKFSLAGRDWFLAGVAALTVLYLALISRKASWLIGTPEYHWPALDHGLVSRLPAALFILLGAGAVGLFLIQALPEVLQSSWGRARVYAAFFLLGLAFQLGPAAAHRMGMIEFPLRVYLADHTSYFTDAAKIEEVGPWLELFPVSIRDLATHSRTHPPGAVLVFYGIQRVMDHLPGVSAAYLRWMPRSQEALYGFRLSAAQVAAGGVSALALLLIAALAMPLTFALGRLIGDDRPAALAALLFASAPAFSHKTPILDHALAVLILAALWLTVSGLKQKQIWRVVIAGIILGAGTWIGTAVLAGLPLCALFAAAACFKFKQDGVSKKKTAVLVFLICVLIAGSALATGLMIQLGLGMDFREVYRAITEVGWKFNNTVSGRIQPWMWIAFDPYEILAWAGLPLSACFLLAVFQALRSAVRRDWAAVSPWLLATVIFLLALDLSGKVCYESARLAWFAFPLIALPAGQQFLKEDLKGGQTFLSGRNIALLLALQIASTLVWRMTF